MKRVSNSKSRPPKADKTRVRRRTAKAAERSAGRSTPHCLSPGGKRGPALSRAGPVYGSLQRVEERDELALLGRGEAAVVVDHGRGLPGVAQDGLVTGQRFPVVPQPVAAPHPPQGRRADLVAGGLAPVRRVGLGWILWIGHSVVDHPPVGGVLGRLQRARDSYFEWFGDRREREQA